jgi:mono/diheme cytochrome c family protein
MSDAPTPYPLTLRNLPLAARLTLAAFLISVGIGYFAALVQLHFQHATPGEALPTLDNAVERFHGHVGPRPETRLEALLTESDTEKRFSGQGQMTAAFTIKSTKPRWKDAIKEKAKDLAARAGNRRGVADQAAAEAELRKERDTERLAVLAWVREGASEKDYNEDKFCLPDDLAKRPMTEKFLVEEDGQVAEPRMVKIKAILEGRCARCHNPGGEDGAAAQYPLDTYANLKKYVSVQTASAMSLPKLAQTTHVHLLGFAMLYGLTGLILSFSTYPRFLRVLLCPLPLVAQVVDISFWWLARLPEPHGPTFARAIVVSGGVVAVGLALHILLSLFNLFSKKAWLVLIVLMGAAAGGGYLAKERVIDAYLAQEKAPAAQE